MSIRSFQIILLWPENGQAPDKATQKRFSLSYLSSTEKRDVLRNTETNLGVPT
jgi:hypothetical protein